MTNEHKIIGYFAHTGTTALCYGDGCIISGDASALRQIICDQADPSKQFTIRKTCFGEIFAGLLLGAAYAFDRVAYDRFSPLARSEGLELAPPPPGDRVFDGVYVRLFVPEMPCTCEVGGDWVMRGPSRLDRLRRSS